MKDRREDILARLRLLLDSIPGVYVSPTGVIATGRNREDISGNSRPAIILHDGSEEQGPAAGQGPRKSAMQLMILRPHFEVLLGARTELVGTQASDFRRELLRAVFTDGTLDDLTAGPTGRGVGDIWFEGTEFSSTQGESREARLVVNIALSYPFLMHELLAA